MKQVALPQGHMCLIYCLKISMGLVQGYTTRAKLVWLLLYNEHNTVYCELHLEFVQFEGAVSLKVMLYLATMPGLQ